MAWSSPTEWERWDPEHLLVCPYDPVHTIAAKRFQYHIMKCRKNHPEKDFVTCPFNAKHVVLRPELRRHIVRCPDKTVLEGDCSGAGDNAKDEEGFYFKGNTSLPVSIWQAPQNEEENWDDEDSTLQQVPPVNTDTLPQQRLTEDIQHPEQISREGLQINNSQSCSVYGQSRPYSNQNNIGQLPYQTTDTCAYKVYQQGNAGHGVIDYNLQRFAINGEPSSLSNHGNISSNVTRSRVPSHDQPSGCNSVFLLSMQQAYNISEKTDQRCETPQVSHTRHTDPQDASEWLISHLPQQTVDYTWQTTPASSVYMGNTNQIGRGHVSGSAHGIEISQPESTGNPYKQNSNSVFSATSLGTGPPEKNTHCGKESRQKDQFASAQPFIATGIDMRGNNSIPIADKESRTQSQVNVLVSSPPKEQMKFTGAGRAKLAEEARRSNFGRILSGRGRGRGQLANVWFKY